MSRETMEYDPRDFWMGSEMIDVAKKSIDGILSPDNPAVNEVYAIMREGVSLGIELALKLAEANDLTSQQKWALQATLEQVMKGVAWSAGTLYFKPDPPLETTGSPTDLRTDRTRLAKFPNRFFPNA